MVLRHTPLSFNNKLREWKLPKLFSKIVGPRGATFCIIGYALGYENNEIYMCLKSTFGSRSNVIAVSVRDFRPQFPSYSELYDAMVDIITPVDTGVSQNAKGEMREAIGVCEVFYGGCKGQSSVLCYSMDSSLPSMLLISRENWNRDFPL